MIEKVIDAAIPLWELTLAPLYAREDFSYFRRIPCDRDDVSIRLVEPSESPDGSLSEHYASTDKEIYKVVRRDPVPFDANDHQMPTPLNFKELYGEEGRPLQIIVKLANIELTPEKPRYGGGTWHVEGKQVRLIV